MTRAEKIEEAAVALLDTYGDPHQGHVRGCSCVDCENKEIERNRGKKL